MQVAFQSEQIFGYIFRASSDKCSKKYDRRYGLQPRAWLVRPMQQKRSSHRQNLLRTVLQH